MKMKKNVAVVMSAVTALGVAAPAVANADTISTSRSDIVSKVREALDKTYESKKDDGLSEAQSDGYKPYANGGLFKPTDNNKSLSDDYMNSVNAVYITTDTNGNLDEDTLNEVHIKGKVADKTIETKNFNDGWYLVDDADQVQKIADLGDEFRVAILPKGEESGKSSRETENAIFISSEKLLKDEQKYKDANSATDKTEAAKKLGYVGLENSLKNEDVQKILEKVLDGSVEIKYFETADKTTVEKDDITKIESKLKPDKTIKSVEFKLKNKDAKKVILKAGEDAVDLLEPVDSNGDKIKKTNADIKDPVWDSVTGFKTVEFKDFDNAKATQNVDLPTGVATVYTISDLATQIDYNVEGIYSSDNGFTDRGADIVDAVRKLYEADKEGANLNGVNYLTKNPGKEKDTFVIDKVDGEYELKVKLKDVINTQDNTKDDLTIVFKGKSISEINDIQSSITSGKEVVAGKFTRLVGRNRYQTAIEISKEKFETEGSANSVVIVAGGAITDGLSAAPLASAKNATVLLAGKNGLDKETLAEIKRATKDNLKNGVAYIVGGDSQVPKAVEKQLQDEFNGVMVNRLSGRDRYATSLDVAKRLNYDGELTNEQAFFVGGHGEADAMSAAPIASIKMNKKEKVSALIVMRKDGIDRETRDFLKKLDLEKGYIVGGNSSISFNGYNDLKKAKQDVNRETGAAGAETGAAGAETGAAGAETGAATDAAGAASAATGAASAIKTANNATMTVTRLSGKSRFDTNKEVINHFYEAKSSKIKNLDAKIKDVDGLFVASGKDNALVDAQTVAAFAANGTEDGKYRGPVILSGDKLTSGQYDQIDKDNNKYLYKDGDNNKPKVYQVGGSVVSEVMKEVVKALDL